MVQFAGAVQLVVLSFVYDDGASEQTSPCSKMDTTYAIGKP